MRRMTKTAVTLAAMSAMAVASASMAFAATSQMPGLSAADPEKTVASGPANGEWIQNSDGWKFKVEGKNLKNTWAEINGVWYYFQNDEYMAQDDILYLDGKAYFFDKNGTMATGWQKITHDMDAFNDVEIPELLYERSNRDKKTNYAYAYDDYFWMYFKNDGSALENEWLQSEAGLWYYFDEYVMIMDVINYPINPSQLKNNRKIYGFDENGAMLTGWNYGKGTDTWNGPTATNSGKRWYYYNPVGGAMQEAGWAKIDGEWYLFGDEDIDYNENDLYDDDNAPTNTYGKSLLVDAYPLIMNAYVQSNKNSKDAEYFYVDEDGKMVKGVYTVPKNAYIITFYNDTKDIAAVWSEDNKTKDKVEINFGSKGAADKEKFVDGHYYAGSKGVATNTWEVDGFDRVGNSSSNRAAIQISVKTLTPVTAPTRTMPVTSSPAGVEIPVGVVASYNAQNFVNDNIQLKEITITKAADAGPIAEAFLIKNALIKQSSELYLADKDGNLVTNRAVTFSSGNYTAKDDNGENITLAYGTNISGVEFTATNGEGSERYIIFDSNGKAVRNTTSTSRTVRVGNISYRFIGETAEVCGVEVDVFVTNTYYNMNQGN